MVSRKQPLTLGEIMSTNPAYQLETAEVIDALEDFGLSDAEVAVYQATLALGSRPASIIAQKSGLKRGHTYNVLRCLMDKGIVQEFLRGSVRHFTCSPPSALLSILDLRQDELARQKDKLRKVLPDLEKLRNPVASDPKVRFFRGLDGIKEIYEDMLRVPGQEIRAVLDATYSWTIAGGEPREWIHSFISRRAEQDIWWRAIINQSDASDEAVRTRPQIKREIKQIENVDLKVEISIFGSKVAILSTNEELVGVLIENEAIAETLSNLHKTVWQALPDYPLHP